jgi:hypothetical protein
LMCITHPFISWVFKEDLLICASIVLCLGDMTVHKTRRTRRLKLPTRKQWNEMHWMMNTLEKQLGKGRETLGWRAVHGGFPRRCSGMNAWTGNLGRQNRIWAGTDMACSLSSRGNWLHIWRKGRNGKHWDLVENHWQEDQREPCKPSLCCIFWARQLMESWEWWMVWADMRFF